MQITLKAARVNAGFTQNQAAKAINKNTMTLANWENGKTDIDARYLYELCELYKVPVNLIILPTKLALS